MIRRPSPMPRSLMNTPIRAPGPGATYGLVHQLCCKVPDRRPSTIASACQRPGWAGGNCCNVCEGCMTGAYWRRHPLKQPNSCRGRTDTPHATLLCVLRNSISAQTHGFTCFCAVHLVCHQLSLRETEQSRWKRSCLKPSAPSHAGRQMPWGGPPHPYLPRQTRRRSCSGSSGFHCCRRRRSTSSVRPEIEEETRRRVLPKSHITGCWAKKGGTSTQTTEEDG